MKEDKLSIRDINSQSTDTTFYLLKTGLNQVLWEKVSDQIQKGIQTADLLVLGGGADLTRSEFWVPRVYAKHQDDT